MITLAQKADVDYGLRDNDHSATSGVLSSPPIFLRLCKEMQWLAKYMGPIQRGENILLSGSPGAGKSTLALQLALSAQAAGEKALIIATELTADQVRARAEMLASKPRYRERRRGIDGLSILDNLYDLALLPMFLRRQLLSSNGIFAGTRLVVIDSLHGAGNPPSDRRFYGKVYEFLRESASAGVTTLLLAHETKGRQIAGPRAWSMHATPR